MSRVKLGDVAREHKETIKGDKSNYPIVGLEHLIPENIRLTQWDYNKENTFTKVFRKGCVLFGRRRAYLKKAVYADFDGICSGDITVIEAIPGKILPELLPFVIQNDDLFDYAVGKSAGSLSPRVKWEHLKNYEFELPEIEKQHELAKILWSIVETKESYERLMGATDELVKSQFIELFGEAATRENKWKIVPIQEVIMKPISGEWGQEDNSGNGVKVLRTTNFTDNGIIDFTDVVTRQIDIKRIHEKRLRDGDILIEKSGGSDTKPVGRVVLFHENSEDYLFNNFTALIRRNDERINNCYLFMCLFVSYLSGQTRNYENKTTGIHNLKLTDYLENTRISLPPLEIQDEFAEFVSQSDKSKFHIRKLIQMKIAIWQKGGKIYANI